MQHSTRAYNGPINPDPQPGEASIIIFGYVPSSSLAAIAAVLWFLALMLHLSVFFKGRRTRTFQALMCIASIMEFVGYVFRIRGHYHPFVVINFVLQYFFIVCAPVFVTGALYLALTTALIRSKTGAELLRFPPKYLLAAFIGADLLATITQIAGAALIGVAESAQNQGKAAPITPAQANDIVLASLAFQSACFLAFLVLLAVVMHRHRTEYHGLIPTTFFVVIFVSSLLIFLRTLFRLAETAQGVFGYASSHEVLFATLEFVPVILALTIWALFPLFHLLAEMTEAEEAELEEGVAEADVSEKKKKESMWRRLRGKGGVSQPGQGGGVGEGEGVAVGGSEAGGAHGLHRSESWKRRHHEKEEREKARERREYEEELSEERKAEQRMEQGFVI